MKENIVPQVICSFASCIHVSLISDDIYSQNVNSTQATQRHHVVYVTAQLTANPWSYKQMKNAVIMKQMFVSVCV